MLFLSMKKVVLKFESCCSKWVKLFKNWQIHTYKLYITVFCTCSEFILTHVTCVNYKMWYAFVGERIVLVLFYLFFYFIFFFLYSCSLQYIFYVD